MGNVLNRNMYRKLCLEIQFNGLNGFIQWGYIFIQNETMKLIPLLAFHHTVALNSNI